MKTIAAVLTKINKPLKIEELSLPPLKKGQVLVEIAYSGICHSQLNEIHGLKGEDKFLPHTLGHEGSGIVLELGPEVTKVKPGDNVVLTWIKGSGHDVPSAQYSRKDCTVVNSGAISTFMTHAVISENRLIPITKKMPLKEAALLGCAIPTGSGIIKNTANLQPEQSVAVFGCGGIGLSAILMAAGINKRDERLVGKAKSPTIIAVDITDSKLSLAEVLGATHNINARQDDYLKLIMDITGGQGVDYAIEAAGKRETMETAFRCVKDKSGLCILAGNLPQGTTISIDPFDLIKGKRIVGTWGGETNPSEDIPHYIRLYQTECLKLGKLITEEYKLEEINNAIKRLHSGEITGRCVIRM